TPEIITDLLSSTLYARSIGKTVDGNAPELFGKELSAHIISTGGTTSCHETTTKAESVEKLRQGVYVFMREGSTQRNMAECIKAITEEKLDSRRAVLATDDMVAEDLEKLGHMNEIVKRTIKEGVDPIEAIQMVTINPCTYFGFKDRGALLPGYLAYPDTVKNSVKLKPVKKEDLEIRAESSEAKVRVIGLIPDQNLSDTGEATLAVKNGVVQPDTKQDVLPIICLERYGRNGNIGKGFVTNFGISSGAIAESIAHDTHNILVTGTSYEDMAVAVNRIIEIGGGIVLAKGGRVIDELPLPVGGLITDELSAHEVSIKIRELEDNASVKLGCRVHAPFMHLSFLGLSTSPKWKITDKGIVDVENFEILSPIIE
ncbi:MAG: adenosine deaminase, partial [Bacteroidetes bacterium 4572_77]